MQPPAEPGMFKSPSQTRVERSVSEAEEMMEAVLRESLRMLRNEVFSELEAVKGTTKRLDLFATSLDLRDTEQKLTRAQEDLKKEVSNHKQVLATSANSHSELKKQVSGQTVQLATCLQALEQIRNDVSLLSSQQAQQVQHKVVSHVNVDQLKNDITSQMSSLRGELMQAIATSTQMLQAKFGISLAGNEQDGEQVADLNAQLLQIKGECVNGQLLEMRGQMQELKAQLLEYKAPPDSTTRSDLQAIREASLKAIQEDMESAKKHISKQISEFQQQIQTLQRQLPQSDARSSSPAPLDREANKLVNKQIINLKTQLSQIKGQQEATTLALQRHKESFKDHVDWQITDLQSHLERNAERALSVARAEIDAARTYLVDQMSNVQGQTQDLQRATDWFHPYVQQELKLLNGHVDEVRRLAHRSNGLSDGGDAQLAIVDVQASMQEHVEMLRQVVESLVKTSIQEKDRERWLAKVVSLEHDLGELRKETSSGFLSPRQNKSDSMTPVSDKANSMTPVTSTTDSMTPVTSKANSMTSVVYKASSRSPATATSI